MSNSEQLGSESVYDVNIAGGGPAGLSAALVLGRCRRRVLVCDRGQYRNAASRGLHGYLTRDCIEPAEFLATAREELPPYPVEIRRRMSVFPLKFADAPIHEAPWATREADLAGRDRLRTR